MIKKERLSSQSIFKSVPRVSHPSRTPHSAFRVAKSWDLYPAFRDTFHSLLGKTRRVLIAVSGGPDSMALWDLTHRCAEETGLQYAVGHVDHGLRGRASWADAAFVRTRARRLGVPCRMAAVPVRAWARRHGKGLEEAARFLRYQALARMARAEKIAFVATAHHQDDQVETILMNIIRGTGPAGLGGMDPTSAWPVPVPGRTPPRLLRPLLDVPRTRIMSYLKQRRIPYRKDVSNNDTTFFRNRIRPVLRQWETLRPGFFARAARLAALQRDEEDFWRRRLDRAWPGLVRRSSDGAFLDLRRFLSYHRSEQRRILRRFLNLSDFAALERIRSLAAGPGPIPTATFSGGRVEKRGPYLVFRTELPLPGRGRKPPSLSPRQRRRVPVPGKIRVDLFHGPRRRRWELRARLVRSLPPGWKKSSRRVYVDADRVDRSSLRCRPWRPGDRFRPLGLAGRKKLQDFFVDEKVPAAGRSTALLLEDRRGVVWVVGQRLDDRVRLTPGTRRILELAAEASWN